MLSQIKSWIFRNQEQKLQEMQKKIKILEKINASQEEIINKLMDKLQDKNIIIKKLKNELKNTTYKWS